MTEEKKRPRNEQYSLEELNQQFKSNIKKKNNKKLKRRVPAVLMLVLLVVVVLITALIIWKVNGTQSLDGSTEDTEIFNESILSEEENEKWATTDLDGEKIYIVLNTKIYLDGSRAYIRLINPIYSTYFYNITICPEGEEDTILYQSEKIAPGTILEAVTLTTEPTEEQYSAIVKYQVYDGEGNELGTHPVNVEFTSEESQVK